MKTLSDNWVLIVLILAICVYSSIRGCACTCACTPLDRCLDKCSQDNVECIAACGAATREEGK